MVAKLDNSSGRTILYTNPDGTWFQIYTSGNAIFIGGPTLDFSAPDAGGAWKIYQFSPTAAGTASKIVVAGAATSGTIDSNVEFGNGDQVEITIGGTSLLAEFAVFNNLSAGERDEGHELSQKQIRPVGKPRECRTSWPGDHNPSDRDHKHAEGEVRAVTIVHDGESGAVVRVSSWPVSPPGGHRSASAWQVRHCRNRADPSRDRRRNSPIGFQFRQCSQSRASSAVPTVIGAPFSANLYVAVLSWAGVP